MSKYANKLTPHWIKERVSNCTGQIFHGYGQVIQFGKYRGQRIGDLLTRIEEIDQIVKAEARGNRPLDRIHDIAGSYGRLLCPWGGRWLMFTDRWRLRLTDRRGFHNCSATGIR